MFCGLKLNKNFTVTLQKSPGKGGWTYVKMKDSATFFGSAAWRKSAARWTASRSKVLSWPQGDGTHKLPVSTKIRKAINKEAGQRITVRLDERLS
jgi:hypothetical protein